MAYESQTVEAVADEFDFFGDVVGKQDPPTLPELQTFANNHIEDDEDKIPKQQGNRVIKRLRSRGLVAVTILPDKAKTRYELTDIGHFVATQLMHLDKGATTL
jgi:DNA-binding PadR family transcriptional regulator